MISAGDRSSRLQMRSISLSAQGRLKAVGRVSNRALDAAWTAARKAPGSPPLSASAARAARAMPMPAATPEGRSAPHRHGADGLRHLLPRGAAHVHLLEGQAPLVDQHHLAVAPEHRPDVVDRRLRRRSRAAPDRRRRGRRHAVAARHDQVPMCQLPRYSTCSGVSSSMSVPSEATLSRAISLSMACGHVVDLLLQRLSRS